MTKMDCRSCYAHDGEDEEKENDYVCTWVKRMNKRIMTYFMYT